ncbi:hypothetical protein HYH03_017777 [Edaphochlamys debaryana]|uniref:Major facilitator superfamily (MFS) profile domain-containing protein n=1 Tax=Edaphochlamys debaryana TaxID=47281 RepID=A0A835XH71_9CHLO|nr:hypothetical protein HYH03_017777 [Edaphochlamys debaryana]|eukprot:KAG2483329.1 hypothetical protein HYH03_017777 [Edaphochlamys debaryana]
MSVAVLPMGEKYGWSDTVKGAVSSAFNLGHTITNFYGGYLAAAYSPKKVLSLGVIVWSAFTLLTPPSAAMGLWPLFFVRACMGLGEGVAYPTMQSIIKGWVPKERRSRSLGLMYSGHQIGSILSLLLSPLIIAASGGHCDYMFYLYGIAGFLWLVLWEPLVSKEPPLLAHDHKAHGPAPTSMRDLPWRMILTNKVFWALMVCHSVFGIIYNTAISWLPRYFNSQFGLDVKASSFLSVLPWVAMAIGTNLSGWIADFCINRKVLSVTATRKTLQVVGSVGPAVCLLYLAWSAPGSMPAAVQSSVVSAVTPPPPVAAEAGAALNAAAVTVAADAARRRTLVEMVLSSTGMGHTAAAQDSAQLQFAVALLVTMMALLGLQAGGFASTHQDISTRMASVLFGTTNAGASLAGSMFVYLTGLILDYTQSWALVFQLIAACCLTASGVFVVYGTSDPQFD